MAKIKIRLDTWTAAVKLATIAHKFENETITITDGNGLRCNAKSFLGAVSATEYEDLWLESENDHWFEFKDFIAEE